MKRMWKLNWLTNASLLILMIVAAGCPLFGQGRAPITIKRINTTRLPRYPATLRILLLSTLMELITQQAPRPNGRRTTLFLPLPMVETGHPQDMFLKNRLPGRCLPSGRPNYFIAMVCITVLHRPKGVRQRFVYWGSHFK